MPDTIKRTGFFICAVGAGIANSMFSSAIKAAFTKYVGQYVPYYKLLNSKLSFRDFMLIYGASELPQIPFKISYMYNGLKKLDKTAKSMLENGAPITEILQHGLENP